MKKILLATDFSAASLKAIHFATALYDDTAAEFCLLNAFRVEPDAMYGTGFMTEALRENSEDSLLRLKLQLQKDNHYPFHTYTTVAFPGDLVAAIQILNEKTPFDVVVLGATGEGMSAFLGSEATRATRNVKANLLIVPATAIIKPLRQVVLATHYTDIAHLDTLDALKELCLKKEAELTLLTVMDFFERVSDFPDKLKKHLTDYFDLIKTQNYFVRNDSAIDGIKEYLDNHQVDLLVTVPHHKSLLDILIGDSVTRELAYRPTVPLLTLYEDETRRIAQSETANQLVHS